METQGINATSLHTKDFQNSISCNFESEHSQVLECVAHSQISKPSVSFEDENNFENENKCLTFIGPASVKLSFESTNFLISDSTFWQESINQFFTPDRCKVLSKRVLLSSEWHTCLDKCHHALPSCAVVDLFHPATVSGSRTDHVLADRISKFISLFIQHQVPLFLVGRSSNLALELKPVHQCLMDPRMHKSTHAACRWNLVNAKTNNTPLLCLE